MGGVIFSNFKRNRECFAHLERQVRVSSQVYWLDISGLNKNKETKQNKINQPTQKLLTIFN